VGPRADKAKIGGRDLQGERKNKQHLSNEWSRLKILLPRGTPALARPTGDSRGAVLLGDAKKKTKAIEGSSWLLHSLKKKKTRPWAVGKRTAIL